MAELSEVFQVYTRNKVVAQVVLNGYGIKSGHLLREHGAMRSFKIVKGDLWDYWNVQTPLTIRANDGQQATIKIAALPTDDDSFGLIEFL